MDVLRGWVEHIKSYNIPAGMAAHQADIHPLAGEGQLPHRLLLPVLLPRRHGTVSARRSGPGRGTIQQIAKPVVAYKILAAGRLPAKEGFRFAFRRLAAKDGACVGVYPPMKAGMLAEDVGLARKLS